MSVMESFASGWRGWPGSMGVWLGGAMPCFFLFESQVNRGVADCLPCLVPKGKRIIQLVISGRFWLSSSVKKHQKTSEQKIP
jgi:hypothetical protein